MTIAYRPIVDQLWMGYAHVCPPVMAMSSILMRKIWKMNEHDSFHDQADGVTMNHLQSQRFPKGELTSATEESVVVHWKLRPRGHQPWEHGNQQQHMSIRSAVIYEYPKHPTA